MVLACVELGELQTKLHIMHTCQHKECDVCLPSPIVNTARAVCMASEALQMAGFQCHGQGLACMGSFKVI